MRIVVAALSMMWAGAVAAQMHERLDAAALHSTLIGNTITGTGRTGCIFYDYYSTDGRATSKCGDYTDTGSWRINEDGQFCLIWSKRAGTNCIELFRSGTSLGMRNPRMGGDLVPVRIEPGDVRR